MRCFDYRGFFVTYERQIHNGMLCFYASNHQTDARINQKFIGYTVAQAKQAIKQLITETVKGHI